MAVVTADECAVATRDDGKVALRLPVGGRERLIVLGAEDAVRIGTRIVGAGADQMTEFTRVPKVSKILLSPFDANGTAMLRIAIDGSGGEALYALDAKWILALAESAKAALEHSEELGTS